MLVNNVYYIGSVTVFCMLHEDTLDDFYVLDRNLQIELIAPRHRAGGYRNGAPLTPVKTFEFFPLQQAITGCNPPFPNLKTTECLTQKAGTHC